MIVTGDSDLLALGHTHVMIVDGWESETHRIYDMTAAGLAIVLQSNELHSNEMLMVRGYDRFGPRLLLEQERFAAATGNRLITFRRWYELLPDSMPQQHASFRKPEIPLMVAAVVSSTCDTWQH